MSPAELLELIIAKLDRGGSPSNRWPDAKGEYWGLCPYHGDQHATNFSASLEGFKCFACGESGSLYKLAEKVEIELPKIEIEKPRPATLESYAEYKKLPVDFLRELGLKTVTQNGRQCLKIPYFDENGQEITHRIRWTIGGDKDKRFTSKSRSKLMPYGLQRLHGCTVAAGDRTHIFLVEGESDAQTLWFYNLPAIGIPGATSWNQKWTDYFKDFIVYIWQEPDQGGEQFVNSITKDIPDAFVITPPAGRKDVSEVHLLGGDVKSAMAILMQEAIPFSKIQAEKRRVEALEAAGVAGELLKCENILAEFSKLCTSMGLIGEDVNAKLLYLALTTRLRDKPVSLALKGTSSSGKSFTIENALLTMPPSAYYALSSLSERALAYSEEPLEHRFLVLYEAAGLTSDFGTYLLRTLLSEGCIRYETVEKTTEGLKPKLIERLGPTGLIITTTWAHLHPENETRMLSLTAKDDRKQTADVMKMLADRQNGKGPTKPDLKPWLAMQTWLELAGNHEVTIPFAPEIAGLASPKAVRLRRDFTKILELICAHCILHQFNREIDSRGKLIATLADYAAVYDLVSDILNENVKASVSEPIRETVKAVQDLTMTESTNIVRVAQRLNIDKSSALRRVRVAIEDGYLVNLEDKKGKPAKLILGEALPEEEGVLPSPEKLAEKINARAIPLCNPATAQPLFSDEPQDMEKELCRADQLALKARELDDIGDLDGAAQLRNEQDLIYSQVWRNLDG
jgi:hypothetical protein